jgi:hypothetical protein
LIYFKNLEGNKNVKTILCYTGTAAQERSNGVSVKPWTKMI